MECLTFTFLSLLAAQLGGIQLAVHNICFAILELAFVTARGMSEGTSLRISYHIGRKDIASAKQVIWLYVSTRVSVFDE